MRAELAIQNHCAVPFLSCAGANLCRYYCIYKCDQCKCTINYHVVMMMLKKVRIKDH